MKRYDLRKYKQAFKMTLLGLLFECRENEIAIFIVENPSKILLKEVMDDIRRNGCEVMNSLRFNEVDWTIVVKVANVKI